MHTWSADESGLTDPQILALRALRLDAAKGTDTFLELLPYLILKGQKLLPEFQIVANAFLAQLILDGAIATEAPRGRPNGSRTTEEMQTTLNYLRRKHANDEKKSREVLVDELAEELEISDRQVGRHISKTLARLKSETEFSRSIGMSGYDSYAEEARGRWMQEKNDSALSELQAMIEEAIEKGSDINPMK